MDAAPQPSAFEDVNAIEQDAHTPTAQQSNYERWSKLPKSRGRQPRDPNAQTVRFQCRNIDDLEKQLREYLEAPSSPAENTTLEFLYPVTSAFMVYAADFRSREQNRAQGRQNEHLYGKLDRCAVSVIDALAQTEDSKLQMRRQKAIAKVCVEACEKVDGFRYSFHNHWLSREDEACRFSYFCNDSTLNKGRAANEGAGTTGKRMRKPVYDCQGLIAIKFSHTKQSLEIHYKHVPLHKTYAERAPPPRRDSKRYKLLEVFDPASLPQKRSKRKQSEEEETPKRSRKRRTIDTDFGDGIDSNTDLMNRDGLQPLVRFLDSADNHVNAEVSSPQNQEHNTDDIDLVPVRPSSNEERPGQAGNIAQTPSIIVESSQEGNATRENNASQGEASTKKPRRKTATPRLRGIVEAASEAVPQSAFEMLKAKLEEAEQRIKKLESEKSQPAQSWPGPTYPFPPPSQYPYSYPPPYPYPPGGYQQSPYSAPPQPTSASVQSRDSHDLRPIQPSTTTPARNFVPYTQAPQNATPAQRHQAVRPLAQATLALDIAAATNVRPSPSISRNMSDRHEQEQPSGKGRNRR